MELPIIPNETMKMTDMMIEETSTAGSSQSSMTESVTSEIAIVQTLEINDTETSGSSKEVEDITEIVEIISEEMTPIK